MSDAQTVLYRKYRPSSFAEVVGQDHIVEALQNAVKSGRVAHGYLFSGSRGTGKTTVARLLARAVNCEKGGKQVPCNNCVVCKELLEGNSIDLIEIDAASNRGIDEIRELREAVRFTPHRAQKKVYIIDEVHMLTREAFNALLKTLEEPPEHAMFILATTELEKVPETIRSRTEHFAFHRLSVAVIERKLAEIAKSEKVKIEKEVPHLIALLAEGSLRDAESMFGQVFGSAGGDVRVEHVSRLFGLPKAGLVAKFVRAATEGDTVSAMTLIGESVEDGVAPKMLAKLAIEELRFALILGVNPAYRKQLEDRFSDEHIAFLEELYKKSGTPGIERALIPLLRAYHSPYTSVLPQIPLELAVLKLRKESEL